MMGFGMKKLVLLAAAAACMFGVGAAQAATIYTQDFSGGLRANESVGGKFSVAGGTVGHQAGNYVNNDYSYYQVRLDLTKATSALLSFDYDLHSEYSWDGFNLAYAVGGVFSPAHLLDPTTPGLFRSLGGCAGELLGPKGLSGLEVGRASFDLAPLLGQVVDIRFQFASDHSLVGRGLKIDNLTVTGGLPSAVPEPATWAMMIVGFGLAGGAVRARRRTFSATAA